MKKVQLITMTLFMMLTLISCNGKNDKISDEPKFHISMEITEVTDFKPKNIDYNSESSELSLEDIFEEESYQYRDTTYTIEYEIEDNKILFDHYSCECEVIYLSIGHSRFDEEESLNDMLKLFKKLKEIVLSGYESYQDGVLILNKVGSGVEIGVKGYMYTFSGVYVTDYVLFDDGDVINFIDFILEKIESVTPNELTVTDRTSGVTKSHTKKL